MEIADMDFTALDTPARLALVAQQQTAWSIVRAQQEIIEGLTRDLIAGDGRALLEAYPQLQSISVEIYGEYNDEGGTFNCMSVSLEEDPSVEDPDEDVDALRDAIDEHFGQTFDADTLERAFGASFTITRAGVEA